MTKFRATIFFLSLISKEDKMKKLLTLFLCLSLMTIGAGFVFATTNATDEGIIKTAGLDPSAKQEPSVIVKATIPDEGVLMKTTTTMATVESTTKLDNSRVTTTLVEMMNSSTHTGEYSTGVAASNENVFSSKVRVDKAIFRLASLQAPQVVMI